ncbi:MAG TPA: metallophosphoesterase family protein [Methanoculleus sp.]|jgi:predicted phosphodiesterase|nr:metallophosphoesterase family protein [Methanoculleus sp.]HPZ33205.1 metallophosphoesterase family protein [Methanoculleus sp.]HQD24413.1 metallophosphoesterase family protein [Methanoculleus sp.]
MKRYCTLLATATAALLLIQAASAGIVWGPYVTNTTSNSTVVSWKATGDTGGWVEYAAVEGGETNRIPSSGTEGGIQHAHLSDLSPATTYRYRVVSGNETTGDCRFRTFGDLEFTCIIYGDTRGQKPLFTQADRHRLVAERIAEEEEFLFLLHTGDFVCDDSEWDEFFSVVGEALNKTTLVPVAGNHDGTAEAFSRIFAVPTDYSFDAGSLHVTVLDSNDRAWADMANRTAWLKEDLRSPLPRKIVAFHHPPFSADRKRPGGDLGIRAEWAEIFSENGVDAVFSAHTHAYERYSVNGTDYFVIGCGGAPFYPLADEKPEGYRMGCEETLGYLRARVSPESIIIEMIPVAKVIDDEVVLYPRGFVIETVRLPAGWWSVFPSVAGVTRLPELWR